MARQQNGTDLPRGERLYGADRPKAKNLIAWAIVDAGGNIQGDELGLSVFFDSRCALNHCIIEHGEYVVKVKVEGWCAHADESDYQKAVLNKEKRIKELEWKLVNMVRWLDAHQPDVWKRGLWDALEPE